MKPHVVILTEGHTEPRAAKTACSLLRYRGEEVLAVLDKFQAGQTTQSLLNAGGETPIVDSLDRVPQADTLLIGIAPPGGKIPGAWRPLILQAISRGMTVVAGLHDFLNDDAEFAEAARASGAELVDVRRTHFNNIALRKGLREECLRIHTVGHDCSVGKMVAAIEINRGLRRRGWDSKFVATGQTGIMVEGDGCPVDRVISDFVSGAAEQLVLDNQHHEALLIEGQGSLVHPSYSAVTLGLLHGCLPHALILCFEAGRRAVGGLEHVPLPPLTEIRRLFETMGGIWRPCPVIGLAINRRQLDDQQARSERQKAEDALQLPVCDVLDEGPETLVQAIEDFDQQRRQNPVKPS